VNAAEQFSWGVSTGGYRWVRAAGRKSDRYDPRGWALAVIDSEAVVRYYYPVGKDEMLAAFLDLGTTSREEVLGFADRYGPLWDLGAHRPLLWDDWGLACVRFGFCALFLQLVEEAEKGGGRALAALENTFHWEGRGIVFIGEGLFRWGERDILCFNSLLPVEQRSKIVVPGDDPTFPTFRKGRDTLPLARLLTGQLITEHIGASVRPELYCEARPKRKQLFVRLRPCDLEGALWLTLLKGVTGEGRYDRCGWCQRYYPVTRKDRTYCSAACRLAAFRQRRATN
jgi:hypothetical protein